VGALALLCDTGSPTRASEGFVKQSVSMLAQKDKQFGFPNLVDNLFFLWIECYRGVPHSWLHPFPAFSVLLSNHPSSAGCVGENSKTHVHVDISPSHMVRSVHEFCLRDRGDETPWMDDPSQPEPQHKRLRRISPGTSWLMRRDMGAMLPHNLS
jgi:hypothetical protein